MFFKKKVSKKITPKALENMKHLVFISIVCKKMGISPEEYLKLFHEATKDMGWINELNKLMVERLKADGHKHANEKGEIIPAKKNG